MEKGQGTAGGGVPDPVGGNLNPCPRGGCDRTGRRPCHALRPAGRAGVRHPAACQWLARYGCKPSIVLRIRSDRTALCRSMLGRQYDYPRRRMVELEVVGAAAVDEDG